MYYVVYGDLQGVQPLSYFWSEYKNKKKFKEVYNSSNLKDNYRIVKEGITKDEAMELCSPRRVTNVLKKKKIKIKAKNKIK